MYIMQHQRWDKHACLTLVVGEGGGGLEQCSLAASLIDDCLSNSVTRTCSGRDPLEERTNMHGA